MQHRAAPRRYELQRIINRLRRWSLVSHSALPVMMVGIIISAVLRKAVSGFIIAVGLSITAVTMAVYCFSLVMGPASFATVAMVLVNELIVLFTIAHGAILSQAELDEIAECAYLIHDVLGNKLVGVLLGCQQLPKLNSAIVLLSATALRALTAVVGYLRSSQEVRDNWWLVLFPCTATSRVLGYLLAQVASDYFSCRTIADVLEGSLVEDETLLKEAPSGSMADSHVMAAFHSKASYSQADSAHLSTSRAESASSGSASSSSVGSKGRPDRTVKFGGLAEVEMQVARKTRACTLDDLIKDTVTQFQQGMPMPMLATATAVPKAMKRRPAPLQVCSAVRGTIGQCRDATVNVVLATTFDNNLIPPLLQGRRVPMVQLQIEPESIGSGSFGVVHKAMWTRAAAPPQLVVAKRIHQHRIVPPELAIFKRALAVELGLRPHRNVCQLYGWACCAESVQLLVVLEHCARGSLASALVAGETALWPQPLKMRISTGLIEGVAFLHSQQPPLIHRDLKPDNILLAEAFSAKICDFGCCRHEDTSRTMSHSAGTPLFRAPEQLSYARYGSSVDVWAVGCLLTCLMRDMTLPYDVIDTGLIFRISRGEARPSVMPGCPLHDIVQACSKFEAVARPTAAQLARHVRSC
mmetsp:Transcript_5817/g.9767  ORF Transcript_5817/g.9767 Transcript_5817/m.9767 type:complete len:639 (+) Transcript_5817:112-2028(+)